MERDMKDNTLEEKNKEEDFSSGLMGHTMMDNFQTTTFMEKVRN